MIHEILIVDDVRSIIRNWGPDLANNQVVQELGGQYWFIDIDWTCERILAAKAKATKPCQNCQFSYMESHECYQCDKIKPFVIDCGECTECLHQLPLKIAWFILEAVRIQKHTMELSIPPTNDSIVQPELRSYIPAQISDSGEIEEIPAQVGVLHVKEV